LYKEPFVSLWPDISNLTVSSTSTKFYVGVLYKRLSITYEFRQNLPSDSHTSVTGSNEFLPTHFTFLDRLEGISYRFSRSTVEQLSFVKIEAVKAMHSWEESIKSCLYFIHFCLTWATFGTWDVRKIVLSHCFVKAICYLRRKWIYIRNPHIYYQILVKNDINIMFSSVCPSRENRREEDSTVLLT